MSLEQTLQWLQFIPLIACATLIFLSYTLGKRSMIPEYILATLITISVTTLFLVYLDYIFYVERSFSLTGMEGIVFLFMEASLQGQLPLALLYFA